MFKMTGAAVAIQHDTNDRPSFMSPVGVWIYLSGELSIT